MPSFAGRLTTSVSASHSTPRTQGAAGPLLPGDAVTVAGGSAIDFVVNDTSKPVRVRPVGPRARLLAYARSHHGVAVTSCS